MLSRFQVFSIMLIHEINNKERNSVHIISMKQLDSHTVLEHLH